MLTRLEWCSFIRDLFVILIISNILCIKVFRVYEIHTNVDQHLSSAPSLAWCAVLLCYICCLNSYFCLFCPSNQIQKNEEKQKKKKPHNKRYNAPAKGFPFWRRQKSLEKIHAQRIVSSFNCSIEQQNIEQKKNKFLIVAEQQQQEQIATDII